MNAGPPIPIARASRISEGLKDKIAQILKNRQEED